MTCAFEGCLRPEACCLVGGCVQQRFAQTPVAEHVLPASKALNGTKPRPVRDPARIRRPRKAITR